MSQAFAPLAKGGGFDFSRIFLLHARFSRFSALPPASPFHIRLLLNSPSSSLKLPEAIFFSLNHFQNPNFSLTGSVIMW